MLEKFREAFPRSIATSAVMFGGVACTFAAGGGIPSTVLLGIKPFIDLLSALAGNIAANDLYKVIADKINHKDVLANGDLARAMADAIAATITFTAQRPERSRLKGEILLLTENTSELLQRFLHGEVTPVVGAAQYELSRLLTPEIADIFTADPQIFSQQKSKISVEGWEELVMWLAIEKNAVLSLDTPRAIATDLHEHFPRIFLEVIKLDFAKDGKAYAALQHQVNNRLLAGQKEIFAAVNVVSQQVANMDQKFERTLDAMRTQMPLDVAKEVENLWRTYETYAAEREIVEKSHKEFKVLKLKESLQNQIRNVLYADPGNTFFRKYVPSTIYFERPDIESDFLDFLAQAEQRSFVAIGAAGMGKTCLLCRLAELLTLHDSKLLPLLMSAESLHLSAPNADELGLAVVELVEALVPSMGGALTFQSFGTFLKENDLKLVIFIDGLNELQGSDAYKNFNAQFERLNDLVAGRGLPVFFVLACRYEWWQYFSASRWADKTIFRKDLVTQATVVLEPPSEKEVKNLSEKYFEYFAIKGELTGEAVRTCQTLLMLRFLCDAYTNRPIDNKNPKSVGIEPYELKEVSSFKKKEILKRYVASRRESFVDFIRNALYDRDAMDTTPSNIYYLTTLYIINIANFMYRKRRASVTADEVLKLAEDLRHPDATLGPERIASSSRSIFLRLIDLGIFSRSGKNAREFSFVYETYFEFSLGRYFAFVRWYELTGGTLEHTAIEEDLDGLIGEHSLLSRDGNFSNLFGALQFAVLATEAGDWINWEAVPAEERVYRQHPRLFSQLVHRLTETKGGFDWLQQACTIIREAELAKRETWSQFDAQGGGRGEAREQFGDLLNALDNLAKTTDFVLLWDIENTLKTLARANLQFTLDHLKRWAESDDSLKTVFAAQVISALALDYPDRVLRLLLEWIQNEKFRSNFWIVRSLLFAASEFTRANYDNDLENNDDWQRLRAEIYKLLDSDLEDGMSAYIGSRALSLLPNLSLSEAAELGRVDRFVERMLNGRDSWKLLNLVFNLADLPNVNRRVEEWIFRTLNRTAEHPNQHLLYAIEKVLDSVGNANLLNPETSKVMAEIEDKIGGRRWLTNVEPTVHARGRTGQIGVVYTPKYLEPDYENHVECRERLLSILNKLEGCGEENFVWVTPREASEKELEKVHNRESDRHRDGSVWGNYIETIKQASVKLGNLREQFERSGPSELRFESFEVAKTAAGGVIKGIDYVHEHGAPAAFVLNRPPGHLANNTICIFNNIAVGAHYALGKWKMKRILIVDCDAHHGKHTQKVFYRSRNVVYFSMHIDGDYAREDGMIKNIGDGEGKGYTFNIPYPHRMGDDGYRFIIDNLLRPVASDFKPELILVSAGFDGHFDDPLTPVCLLSEQSYMHLARTLREIAERNECKIVGALEGGYGLQGMPNSLAQMLNIWGDWNLEAEIGYTPKPAGYDDRLDPEALDRVRRLVAERIDLMYETKRLDDSYFFNPESRHWHDGSGA